MDRCDPRGRTTCNRRTAFCSDRCSSLRNKRPFRMHSQYHRTHLHLARGSGRPVGCSGTPPFLPSSAHGPQRTHAHRGTQCACVHHLCTLLGRTAPQHIGAFIDRNVFDHIIGQRVAGDGIDVNFPRLVAMVAGLSLHCIWKIFDHRIGCH